ncbi:MAG: RNA methyltransferase [Clostridia bacterium]|nr:RNA methyltransferase [Clostridia bacterium]
MNPTGEIIYSRQNRTVVEVCKLSDRKARDAGKIFRFDGIKLFEEAVKKGVEIQTVLLRASSADKIQAEMTRRCGEGVLERFPRVLMLSDEVFEKISEEKSPEGVICVAKYIDKFQKFATIYNSGNFLPSKEERLVLVEAVRDPSNVGAIIRSAAALGVDRLIMSADCADIYHPKAVRASMGTLFDQKIDRVQDMAKTVQDLRADGRRVFAAALKEDAKVLGSFSIGKGDCVVIGNEGHGLSEETINACDGCVIIPMTERAESLNAAVAASILMWEFSKC